MLPTRSEIEILRKKAMLSDIFTEQLKEAKDHLIILQREKMKREKEDEKRLEEERLNADMIDPRLRSKTHRELVDLVTLHNINFNNSYDLTCFASKRLWIWRVNWSSCVSSWPSMAV